MGKCTWEGCSNDANHELQGKDGNIWAKLCEEHNKELNDEIRPNNPKGILRSWVLAQGGAKKATKSIMKGF